jgi:type I restriction-modification system DNA methylase subunit
MPPTVEKIRNAVANIRTQSDFIQNLLIDTLEWQIPADVERIEDISFEWTQQDLRVQGLDRQIVDGRIYQVQPIREGQPWGIFILEFANHDAFLSGRGLKGALRKILRSLVPKRRAQGQRPVWNRECLLFICTHNYEHFTFAYFKKPNTQGLSEPLTTFGWGHDVTSRTAYENLLHLGWPDADITAEQWVKKWSEAFDIEKVTRKFYEDYEEIFDNLQQVVNGLENEDEEKEDEDKKIFVQTLMNRLLFLRFVEKKGWLRFGDETRPQNYLQRLFRAGQIGNQSWYNSRLKVLFFEGMALPNHEREGIIGQVPYLNGGLFEKKELDDRVIDIPNNAFEPILGEEGLFYKYNFTVEESTPLDIDVAVDPEMLGKVFEKLVNGRRDTGSYYTPRTIVSFMCREAIKGYLGSQNAPFIDERKSTDISVPQARELLQRLDKIKVVDPACGSGAYLLGMLHELYDLTSLLDTRIQTLTPKDAYHRKLSIIQNNLYGVDLDDFAVNIARLRLWLSLAVEFVGDTPQPLPNLDFKIESGDSLTAPDPSGTIEPGLHRVLMQRYVEMRQSYLNPPPGTDKSVLLRRINEVKEGIREWIHASGPVDGFDWQVEFLEVFAVGGFDIVLANPPYGIKVEDSIRNQYFNQRSENERGQSKDSYGIFMARGLQLLRPGGTMSYIVSDTWRTIKSNRPLRKRILDNTTVFHILDLPSWIFDAVVNTGIITLRKAPVSEEHKLIAGDLRAIEKDNWKTLSDNLIAVSGHGPDIQTINCARYTYLQNDILKFSNIPFFIASPKLFQIMSDMGNQNGNPNVLCEYIIRHNNKEIEVIKINELVEEICGGIKSYDNHRYIKSKDGNEGYARIKETLIIRRELTDTEKKDGIIIIDEHTPYYLTFEKGGETIKANSCFNNYYYPTNFYFPWDQRTVQELEPRNALRNKHRYFSRGIGITAAGIYSPLFRYSELQLFQNGFQVMFFRSNVETDVLGILCSTLIRYVFNVYLNHSVNSNAQDIELVPILKNIPNSLVEKVVSLLESLKENPEYNYIREQKEIDALVYQLYGLSEDDIREVELWYCRRYQKLAEAQGLLAEVKEKYAGHLERCKHILEKPPSYWRSNPILQLIAQGESHTLEFKETLEWDARQNQHAPYLNKESLKTIDAFLNSSGGTLLIGVADNGQIMGLDRDLRHVHRNNLDGFQLKLRNLIRDHLNPAPTDNVQINFKELAEGTICQVDVQPSAPVTHFDNDVFIRDGNGTRKLEGRALTDWIQQRTQQMRQSPPTAAGQ